MNPNVTVDYLDADGIRQTFVDDRRYLTFTKGGILYASDSGTWVFVPWGRILWVNGYTPVPDGMN